VESRPPHLDSYSAANDKKIIADLEDSLASTLADMDRVNKQNSELVAVNRRLLGEVENCKSKMNEAPSHAENRHLKEQLQEAMKERKLQEVAITKENENLQKTVSALRNQVSKMEKQYTEKKGAKK
tara:strand:+ start:652 stop:1029 length:378 start_codon:yes stop_codon:yes gene_type:complete